MDRKKTRSEVGWGVEWQKRREKCEQKQREKLKDEGFKEATCGWRWRSEAAYESEGEVQE